MSTEIVLANRAKEGDSIIIYEDAKTSRIVKLTNTGYFDTRFGRFLHKDIVGKEFGSRLYTKNGYVYMLRPSPSLITQSLPHRTQILYNLQPGSIVVESGTGSGSLSSSLATVIGPKGFLYTFEFNQDRAEKAQKEFDNLGFKNIKVTWRDACADGFLPKEDQDYQLKECDAVFLDLPKPWEAIPHATKVLKKGGRICCFSPCIEQVQKTCLELKDHNFVEVRSFECIGRNYEKRRNPYKEFRLGPNPNFNKRKGRELEDEKPVTKKEKLESNTDSSNLETNVEENKLEDTNQGLSSNDDLGKSATTIQQEKDNLANNAAQKGSQRRNDCYFTSGNQFTQGHTGYLTFAIKM